MSDMPSPIGIEKAPPPVENQSDAHVHDRLRKECEFRPLPKNEKTLPGVLDFEPIGCGHHAAPPAEAKPVTVEKPPVAKPPMWKHRQ